MKRWQFWAGLAISGVFLWLALGGLHLADVWQVLRTANLWWLIPGIAVYFVGVWARAWRWHYLLRPIKAISTNTMFPIVAIGYMGNNIYPARAGEVLRAFILRRRQGVPVSASLATIVVERIFDGVVMLMFVVFNLNGLAALSHDSGFVGSIQAVAIWGTAAFAAALAVFLLAAMFPHQSLGLFHRFVEPVMPAGRHSMLTVPGPSKPAARITRNLIAISPFWTRADLGSSTTIVNGAGSVTASANRSTTVCR